MQNRDDEKQHCLVTIPLSPVLLFPLQEALFEYEPDEVLVLY